MIKPLTEVSAKYGGVMYFSYILDLSFSKTLLSL